MTSQDLYAIYVSEYATTPHFDVRRPERKPEGVRSRLRRLLSLGRLIEDLARHDAHNGRALRSREELEAALHRARPLLEGMGRLAEAAARP